MTVMLINPSNGLPLHRRGNELVDDAGNSFAIAKEIPRICPPDNYTASFGKQWNLFRTTQIDGEGVSGNVSEVRLFAETGWNPDDLAGLDILEVGSGAGRFSRVLLAKTRANLFSVDYSTAVEANLQNNRDVGGDRLNLFQASVYEMPFPDNSFDKCLCLGVLQHTPDFERSVHALIDKAKPGGEIVVDFYAIRGWWTKVHAKYLLRPISKRMPQERLLGLIEANANRLIAASRLLGRLKLGKLRRFLPVVDLDTMPASLDERQLREWVVLDTFDMLSPEHDHPQRLASVAKMFERGGAKVTFADYVANGGGMAAVVRAIKR